MSSYVKVDAESLRKSIRERTTCSGVSTRANTRRKPRRTPQRKKSRDAPLMFNYVKVFRKKIQGEHQREHQMLLAENQLNAKVTTSKSSSQRTTAQAMPSQVQRRPAMSMYVQRTLREITMESTRCSSLRTSKAPQRTPERAAAKKPTPPGMLSYLQPCPAM